MAGNTTTEINRLNKAVNDFSEQMKGILNYHAAVGKRGWDDEPAYVFLELIDKKITEINILEELKSVEKMEKARRLAVDLANLSMFLYESLKEEK